MTSMHQRGLCAVRYPLALLQAVLLLLASPDAVAQRSTVREPADRYLHPAPDGSGWQESFGPSSGSTVFSAIAFDGDDIYVAGSFSRIDTIEANNIARWNRRTGVWSRLGSGVTLTPAPEGIAVGAIYDIDHVGDDLYVSGYFTQAGGIAARNIARWNIPTGSWHALGEGIDSHGLTLAYVHGRVYVGGWFDSAGGHPAHRLAAWDHAAQRWDTTFRGVNGYVEVLQAGGGSLFVGGEFDTAGSIYSHNLARWTGQEWQSVGGSPNNSVSGLAYAGGELFVTGYFSGIDLPSGSVSAPGIARWNGAVWSALPSDARFGSHDVESVDSLIYSMTRGQSSANPETTIRTYSRASGALLRKWTFKGRTESLYGDGADMLLLGSFMLDDSGRVSLNVARLSGGRVEPVVGSMFRSVSGKVNATVLCGSDLFAAGSFRVAGDSVASNIARWERTTQTWHSLGRGVNGEVHAVAVRGDSLIVGGSFDSAGGAPAHRIACWDLGRRRWSPMDTGIGVVVRTLAVDSGNLYAAGYDTATTSRYNGTSPGAVARWNGRSWIPLGGGAFDQGITAMTIHKGQLYAAGGFRKIGEDTTMAFMARWDGTAWNAIGTPLATTEVWVKSHAIAVHDGDIYVGGYYYKPFGPEERISLFRWRSAAGVWELIDRSGWSEIHAFLSTPDGLYVGGEFDSIGHVPARSIARIEGSEVVPVSPGVSKRVFDGDSLRYLRGAVWSLAYDGSRLFVGGLFDYVSDIPSNNMGEWIEPDRAVNILLEPRTLDFGSVAVGESKELSFRITNDSTSTTFLRGSVDSSLGTMTVVEGAGRYILAPGSSRTVRVRFAPTAGTSVSDLIAEDHNATNEATAAVHLLGSSGSSRVATDGYDMSGPPLSCSPNPAATRAAIRFASVRGEEVTLTIENSRGERVALLVDRSGLSGEQIVEWDLSGIASGLYMAIVESGYGRRSVPIIVVR